MLFLWTIDATLFFVCTIFFVLLNNISCLLSSLFPWPNFNVIPKALSYCSEHHSLQPPQWTFVWLSWLFNKCHKVNLHPTVLLLSLYNFKACINLIWLLDFFTRKACNFKCSNSFKHGYWTSPAVEGLGDHQCNHPWEDHYLYPPPPWIIILMISLGDQDRLIRIIVTFMLTLIFAFIREDGVIALVSLKLISWFLRTINLQQSVEQWVITIPPFWLDSQGRKEFKFSFNR